MNLINFMKKIFTICILLAVFLVVGIWFENGDCLRVEEIEVGRLISLDKDCDLKWNYVPKMGSDDSFSVERLGDSKPFWLQFAGPFTDEDGTTQGISFLNGEIVEDDGDYYSGYVVVDNDGGLRIGNLNEFDDFRKEIELNAWSGFTQALMIEEGKVVSEVRENWNLYAENRSYNYRFLVETRDGQVKVLDGINNGLADMLNSMVELGFEKAIYLDIAGSELGYYFEDGEYKLLGGRLVEERYNPNSPGGFLELRDR